MSTQLREWGSLLLSAQRSDPALFRCLLASPLHISTTSLHALLVAKQLMPSTNLNQAKPSKLDLEAGMSCNGPWTTLSGNRAFMPARRTSEAMSTVDPVASQSSSQSSWPPQAFWKAGGTSVQCSNLFSLSSPAICISSKD